MHRWAQDLQETDVKDREEVEQLLRPTTQPATQPSAAGKGGGDTQAATVLRRPPSQPKPPAKKTQPMRWWMTAFASIGTTPFTACKMEMLWEALVDADQNYYRNISYKDLALGGLRGLRAVLTTKGLETASPSWPTPIAETSSSAPSTKPPSRTERPRQSRTGCSAEHADAHEDGESRHR